MVYVFVALMSLFSLELYAKDIIWNLNILTKTLINLEQSLQPISQEDQEIFEKYPQLFKNIPLAYKKILLQYFKDKKLFSSINDQKTVHKYMYQAMADYFGIENYYNIQQDFTYIDRQHKFLHGYRIHEPSILQYNKGDGSLKTLSEDQKNSLAQNYKIHLMPKPEDVPAVFIRLLDEIVKKDSELASLLSDFKIKFDLQDLKDSHNETLPIMVLYPRSGKENSQKLLNIIYSLFKDVQGLNVTPRYNQKVTDLIYFAQGNADDKNVIKIIITNKRKPDWVEFDYFEHPDMVYFKPDFVTPGKPVDYKLKDPATMHSKL